jgi:hypothetical protein
MMAVNSITDEYKFARFPFEDSCKRKPLQSEPGEAYQPGDEVFVKLKYGMIVLFLTASRSPSFSFFI